MLLSEVTSTGVYEVTRACVLQAVLPSKCDQPSEFGQLNSQVQLRTGDCIVVETITKGVLSVRVQFAGTALTISRVVPPNTNGAGSSVAVNPRATD